MSVDSGIPTYRGECEWYMGKKEIQIGKETVAYDEISSLKMWKEHPELAWGFKAHFYKLMNALSLIKDIMNY